MTRLLRLTSQVLGIKVSEVYSYFSVSLALKLHPLAGCGPGNGMSCVMSTAYAVSLPFHLKFTLQHVSIVIQTICLDYHCVADSFKFAHYKLNTSL